MCLSTVYRGEIAEEGSRLAEYITFIEIDGDNIRLTGLTGEEMSVRGAIRNIDLIGGRVFIDTN